jgi:citrate synthase
MVADPEQKIARPRQLYLGAERRDFVRLDRRGPDEQVD